MIRVTFGNNMTRKSDIVDENTTIMQALKDHGMDTSSGAFHLNGATLSNNDLGRKFTDFPQAIASGDVFLLNVQNLKNANPEERAGWTLLDKVRVFFAKAFRVE